MCVLRLRDPQVIFHLRARRMGENQPWLPAPVSSPHTNWLKKFLWDHFGPRSDAEHAVRTDHAAHRSCCSRQLLIVAFLTMLALTVMGLLLFFNYQCIFVWHLCREDEEDPSTSAFGD